MTPAEVFADAFLNIELADFEKELDLLVEIALVTENGSYDEARERDHLIYLRKTLTEVLNAANLLAEKQRRRFIRKVELRAREGGAHKPSAFSQPENSAGASNGVS
jgi:hypothetical protein